MKTHWKGIFITGLGSKILIAAVSLLIYSNHVAAQQKNQEPPAGVDEIGVPRDPMPLERFRTAAEQGQAPAQFHMGSIYSSGRGVKQDFIQAYKWLTLSLDGSTDKSSPTFQKATDLRDSVSRKMTSRQVKEAEQLAKEWESRYVQRMGDGPFIAGWGVSTPAALVRPLPTYTDQAREARISGTVGIQCIIHKDGTVGSCKIIKGLGYGLDESAIDTITAKWRFQPGTFQGKPVDMQTMIGISFRIE
jgi:TonB family protein